jgi:hypothetical protein
MKPVAVRGVGFWSPGHPGPASWATGRPDPDAQEPPAALLAGGTRRRTSGLTRMAAEVFEQAVRAADADPASVWSVWATAHGEIEIAVHMLEAMNRGSGKISPTRFQNSVYNTASGYVSIATGNRAPATTLAGGPELVGTTLVETFCQLAAGASEVVAVLADEPLHPPLDACGTTAGMAIALCLSSDTRGAGAVLSGLRRADVKPVPQREPFAGLYVSGALPLLESIAAGRPGTVPLQVESGDPGPVWCLDLELH